jgi:hypothetical protein
VCYGFAPMIAARIKPETAHGVQRVIPFVLLSIREIFDELRWHWLLAMMAVWTWTTATM